MTAGKLGTKWAERFHVEYHHENRCQTDSKGLSLVNHFFPATLMLLKMLTVELSIFDGSSKQFWKFLKPFKDVRGKTYQQNVHAILNPAIRMHDRALDLTIRQYPQHL